MKDKAVYIITGATGGIGQEIALSLAHEGKCVMLACRNLVKGEDLKQRIVSTTGNINITVEQLELNSPDSITDFARRINQSNVSVHALINNAGVMCRKYSLTVDGIEETLAVNYFNTLLLTHLLLNRIEDRGKIIFTTSITRKLHRLNDDTLNVSELNFSQLGIYARSKCAITHYSLYLASILKSRNIAVNCSDPGIVNSGMITMNRWFDPIANILFRPLISSTQDGARATMQALNATDSGYIYTQKRRTQISTTLLNREECESLISTTHTILKLT